MRDRRAAMSSEEHASNLERKRNKYHDMPRQQKEQYLMKKRIAIKNCRENYTEEERQGELAANSIRRF